MIGTFKLLMVVQTNAKLNRALTAFLYHQFVLQFVVTGKCLVNHVMTEMSKMGTDAIRIVRLRMAGFAFQIILWFHLLAY